MVTFDAGNSISYKLKKKQKWLKKKHYKRKKNIQG